ncbi:dTDP-4-dehydrorhamnose 3,5-epimerase [Pontiellaceae bacterium B12227]|nr:dTDP-4-dehydrorhamnose 3,5-epimerase [Pontiellaceae bacterium B12227]
MTFEPLPLKDAWLIKLAPFGDDRGHYARAWCAKEFEEHGIDPTFVQMNTVFSKAAGTMRGMHWQTDPAAEPKFVRCIRGALYDVMVDMRPESATYKQYVGVELSTDNQTMVYVPGNFAHGFLTLENDTEACYMVGEYYTPACERGFRHDDPTIGIEWPADITVISEKDKTWPLLGVLK